jgi:hypothetical protein
VHVPHSDSPILLSWIIGIRIQHKFQIADVGEKNSINISKTEHFVMRGGGDGGDAGVRKIKTNKKLYIKRNADLQISKSRFLTDQISLQVCTTYAYILYVHVCMYVCMFVLSWEGKRPWKWADSSSKESYQISKGLLLQNCEPEQALIQDRPSLRRGTY